MSDLEVQLTVVETKCGSTVQLVNRCMGTSSVTTPFLSLDWILPVVSLPGRCKDGVSTGLTSRIIAVVSSPREGTKSRVFLVGSTTACSPFLSPHSSLFRPPDTREEVREEILLSNRESSLSSTILVLLLTFQVRIRTLSSRVRVFIRSRRVF